MKKIKSFEDACKKLGLDPTKLPDVSMLPDKHQKAIIAFCKLIIIVEAINNGWTPNWNDHNQWKYYAWFGIEASEEKQSGSGFSRSVYGSSYSFTIVGSRLCFETSDQAEYAAQQFKDLYQDYLLLP